MTLKELALEEAKEKPLRPSDIFGYQFGDCQIMGMDAWGLPGLIINEMNLLRKPLEFIHLDYLKEGVYLLSDLPQLAGPIVKIEKTYSEGRYLEIRIVNADEDRVHMPHPQGAFPDRLQYIHDQEEAHRIFENHEKVRQVRKSIYPYS